jgi:hypothetical protein
VGCCKGVQCTAGCILSQKDVCRILEILVNECSRRGVARCRDWAEALHMPAQLVDEVRWLHGAGGWGQ